MESSTCFFGRKGPENNCADLCPRKKPGPKPRPRVFIIGRVRAGEGFIVQITGNRDAEYLSEHRYADCPEKRSDVCRDKAIALFWNAFSCLECPKYGDPT